jgi:hypothetical protein
MATVRLPSSIQDSAAGQDLLAQQSSFDADTRQQMMADDLSAGWSVSMILIAVVSVGLLLMIGSVLATL